MWQESHTDLARYGSEKRGFRVQLTCLDCAMKMHLSSTDVRGKVGEK